MGSNYGTVSGHATGDVSGTRLVGGLVGNNNGTVSGHATGDVSGTGWVGGLVGFNNERDTVSGYAMGAVSGETTLGGLVGGNKGGTVSGYAMGMVSATSSVVGGLVGHNESGTVSGYAMGMVSATSNYVGGLVGYNESGTVNGYATGAVSGAGNDVGGLVGFNDLTVSVHGYWDKASTKQPSSAEGIGISIGISATMKIVFADGSYTDAGTTPANPIFDSTAFTAIFDTTNGANATWPKLKPAYTFNGDDYTFNFPQPKVNDINGDGTIDLELE